MNSSLQELLAATVSMWGLHLDEQQLARFAGYADQLLDWNEHTNLTAVRSRDEVYVRHFLDSLVLARHWGEPPASLVDIGTGAGFPGLPLKILRPELRLVLIDSVGKKTAFLEQIVATLGLADVRVLTGRVEELGRNAAERERYDLVTARAVADLRVLAEYGLPLLRLGGRLLAPKGAAATEETERAARAIELLGGRLSAIEPVLLPGLEPRALVIIEKYRRTDPRYPRAVGLPAKKPL